MTGLEFVLKTSFILKTEMSHPVFYLFIRNWGNRLKISIELSPVVIEISVAFSQAIWRSSGQYTKLGPIV